jgi:ABC-2 type transport system ATP-binding protein
MAPLLRIQNISKTFPTSNGGIRHALTDINLEILEGEIFALLGSNGAGKTTLSSIIATLHPPTFGTIYYKEQEIYNMLHAYRQQVGFCPQNNNLDKFLTVRENLYFAGRYYGLSHEELQKRLDILIEKLELGDYADTPIRVLSGGYVQRVTIARSTIHSPSILLLDEPTVALDPHIRRRLWEYILQLKKEGTTIILTTHYFEEAEYLADRVCILHQGKIRLIDTKERIIAEHKKKLEDVFIDLLSESMGENI